MDSFQTKTDRAHLTSAKAIISLATITSDEDIEQQRDLIYTYSAFKLGSVQHLDLLAGDLHRKIASTIALHSNCVLMTPSFAHLAPVYPLGVRLAQNMQLPVLSIQSKAANSLEIVYAAIDTYGERHTIRKNHQMYVDASLHGKKIIFIDDAITTGATASLVFELLTASGAESVAMFTLLNIAHGRACAEDRINNYLIEKGGVANFAELLNDPKVIINRNTLQAIFGLEPAQKKQLSKMLNSTIKTKIGALSELQSYQTFSDLDD